MLGNRLDALKAMEARYDGPVDARALEAAMRPSEGVWQICPTCQGYGHTRDSSRTKCPDCEGRAGKFVQAAERKAA